MPEKNKAIYKVYVLAIALAALVCALLLCCFSLLLTKKDLGQEVVKILALGSLGIGSFVGGFFAGKKIQKGGLQIGAIVGGIIFVLISTIAIAVNGMSFSILSIVKFTVCMILGAIGAIWGVNSSLKRKL